MKTISLSFLVTVTTLTAGWAQPFTFVALGDTTYAIPADDPLYRPVTELDLDTPAVRHPNLTRLQVYGWPDMKAVQVKVDTSKPWVFGFEPVYAARQSVSRSSHAHLAEPRRP